MNHLFLWLSIGNCLLPYRLLQLHCYLLLLESLHPLNEVLRPIPIRFRLGHICLNHFHHAPMSLVLNLFRHDLSFPDIHRSRHLFHEDMIYHTHSCCFLLGSIHFSCTIRQLLPILHLSSDAIPFLCSRTLFSPDQN